MSSKVILPAVGALVLLNGFVGVLLWSGIPTILGDAVNATAPIAPNRRLVLTVWPVSTQVSSFPYYPAGYQNDTQHSPMEVWVHVWTHDTGQRTYMSYAMLPLRRLAMFPLLTVSPDLALLTLGILHSLRRVRSDASLQPADDNPV